MLNYSNNFFTKLDLLKNKSTIGQLLYIAEQALDTASLIGFETDQRRRKYTELSDQIKEIRYQRKGLSR